MTAFESVGAILVIAVLIVPAATARLLTDRLVVMVPLTAGTGWVAAVAGYAGALRLDASIAGAMGVVATACFAVALVAAPRHGLLARTRRRRRGTVRTARAVAPGTGSR